MSQKIKIWIPAYYSSINYNPARVLPRLFFYNGQLDCENWWMEDQNGSGRVQSSFPYFDNYNVVSGSFPTEDSESLLFNNEAAVYGTIPAQSLYTNYWEKYISLLYNPRTRVINCSAIIPFADYNKLTLNDIIEWRGNYYHLRAVNNYSVKTGNCDLQLLGPIIADTFGITPTEPTSSHQATINYLNISNGAAPSEFRIYDNGSNIVTLTTTTGGSTTVNDGHIINAELNATSWPSSGSVTMSLQINGGTTIYTSTNSNTILTSSFTAHSGSTYNITGSIEWNDTPPVYEWYGLVNCDTSATETSIAYNENTFNLGDIVTNVGYSSYYTVTNVYSSDPGGSHINIYSSGLYTCPDTNCYNYTYHAYAGCTIYWIACNGSTQSHYVNNGETYNISCMKSYGYSGCGLWTQGGMC